MKEINGLVMAAHSNAISKGWWDEERTFGEIIALVHSEVSEALEDYRNHKGINEVWYENPAGHSWSSQTGEFQKPCGIPSELADICIRIFDIAGKYNWGPRLEGRITVSNTWHEREYNFAEELTDIHHDLSQAWISHNKHNEHYAIVNLSHAVLSVMQMSRKYRIDLEQAILEKMAYNATRPQRHGGKVI